MLDQTRHTMKILWLEDNPDEIRSLLPAVCKEFHANIDLAENPNRAEEYLLKNEYELFLLDIEIAGERTTGIQLAEHIRRLPQYMTTPIIFTSMYTHCSRRLLATILHTSFLAKPIVEKQLILQIGVALGLPKFLEEYYQPPYLVIPTTSKAVIEVDPIEISYIQFLNNRIFVQFINGRQLSISRKVCSFQEIIYQIKELKLDSLLRQIYRSIIVNVEQIKKIIIQKNAASVILFQDDCPKPLGIRFRKNLAEYLSERGESDVV